MRMLYRTICSVYKNGVGIACDIVCTLVENNLFLHTQYGSLKMKKNTE